MNVVNCANECSQLNLQPPENTAFAIAENKYKTSIKQDIKQANKQERKNHTKKWKFLQMK